MKHVVVIGCVLLLASCGGGGGFKKADRSFARALPLGSSSGSGPISKACLNSDRKKRSASLCSCIQTAADETLSRADQRRSIAFYNDPHLAQKIRQSDRPQDEDFWKAYAKYSKRAEQMCG